MNPFFSIIIPIYNSQKYFKPCLSSILGQNFNNYEVLIVNDASNDGTKKICNNFKKLSSKIKIIENKKNLGVSVSRNKGIKKAIPKKRNLFSFLLTKCFPGNIFFIIFKFN